MRIRASKLQDRLLLEVQSDCEHIASLAKALGDSLDRRDPFAPLGKNLVYERAAAVMPGCASCIVPGAIVRALWAEQGALLKKDASIHFEA